MKTLKDCILHNKQSLPKDLCERLIQEYEPSGLWHRSTSTTQEYRPNDRTSFGIDISSREVTAGNYDVRYGLDQEVFHYVSLALKQYREKFPFVNVSTDTGFTILRYEKGQKFVWHADEGPTLPRRCLSATFLLNEDFTGGNFLMFDQDKTKIPLKTGDSIIFPSNFLFTHTVTPVRSGRRYSLIVWFM